MRIAVTSAVYNEEKNIARFIEALLNQSFSADEIIIVDDGSTDGTAEIIKKYATEHESVQYYFQENKGPATARNLAWKKSTSEFCLFTDGDCIPEPDWIENLIPAFDDSDVGAVAGTYSTLNPENFLASFIGYEIEWRYRNIKAEVNAHGSYNLAVRKSVLEEIGGFREDYPKPSGEDFDLTYKISKRYKIIFVREAVVGHFHPESLSWYLKNQARRAYDRMKVYRDHPDKQQSDTYTGSLPKFQALGAGLLIFLVFLSTHSSFFDGFTNLVFLALFISCSTEVPFLLERNQTIAFISPFIIFLRSFSWFFGALTGWIKFSLLKLES
jgi:cellulose synthase/poly-beta-1,6-N-acetylglucosamine synthase-like glycosyltransferase